MKKVLTCDFDDTLVHTSPVFDGVLWTSTGTMKAHASVCNFVWEKIRESWEAHIVTFRHESTGAEEVEAFLDRYKIPFKSVHYTEGGNKTPILKKLNSSLHIDDNVEVCMLASLAGIDVLLVDDKKMHKSNTTADLFKKIYV